MAGDMNSDDLDRLMKEIAKVSDSIGGYTKSMKEKEDQKKKDDADDARRKNAFNGRVATFGTSLENAKDSIGHFTKGLEHGIGSIAKSMLSPLGKEAFLGIAVLGTLFEAGKELNETWREMADIGQTFGGSMETMQKAAFSAGLPLETFAKLQSKHNVTISSTNGSFFAINKQLRQNIQAQGMYGMSMEQLGDFQASYMEISRQNGTAQSRSSSQLVGDMQDLALSTTALAKASDKTREQITALATQSMSSALSIAAISLLPEQIRGTVDKAVKIASVGFAAMPNEAGSFMSKFFNDSLAGQAQMTDGGNSLVKAGLGSLVSDMRGVADSVKNQTMDGTDAMVKVRNDFIDKVGANMQMLENQAKMGNADAANAIKIFADLGGAQGKITRAQVEKDKKDADRANATTAFFASLDSVIAGLKGAFGESFMNGFTNAAKAFGDIGKSLKDGGKLKKLTDFVGEMGNRLGTLLGKQLTNENIDNLMSGIKSLTDGFLTMFQIVAESGPLWFTLGAALKVVTLPVSLLASVFDELNKKAGGLTTTIEKVAGAFLGAMTIVALIKKMKSLFGSNNMVVNANNVAVNGGVGGLGSNPAATIAEEEAAAAEGKTGTGLLGGIKGIWGARKAAGGVGMLGLAKNGIKGLGGVAGRFGLGMLKGPFGRGLIGMGAGAAADYAADNGYNKTAIGLGTLGTALQYGSTGALVGGMLGPAGAAIGELGGAAYGAYSGYSDYSSRAAAGVAATNAALAKPDDDSKNGPKDDPNKDLIDSINRLRQDIRAGDAVTHSKLATIGNNAKNIATNTQ